MNKLMASALAVGAVALAAQAETAIAPMENPSWGYVISGLGDSGREAAYVFTNTTAQMSWTAPLDVASAELLVVGGGGAGGAGDNPGWGNGGGGGGGAGGFRHIASQPVSPGQIYSVAVGAGAAAATQSASVETKGGDSRFEDVVAHGGGSGGSGSDGYAGGSGGGGGSGHVKNKSFVAYAAGKTVDPTEGKDGGNSDAYGNVNGGYGTGGGGGGASQAGIPAGKRGSDVDTDFGGEGGEGVVCDITGVDVVYSSGGGGGSVSGCDRPAVGGTGAGIGGGKDATNGGDAIGYGCGGGGGSTLGDMGGAGFQGIVVVRVNPTLNAWVEEPGLSATEWVVDQAPEDLAINFGRALHGEVTCNMTVDDLKALTMGNYDVVFTASADGYETIAKTNAVKVIAEAVGITLTDEQGDPIKAEDLSAGSTVVVNFTDNGNQDLVLSVAYGRYDKGEDFTHDPDTLDKAAEEKRDYDPEHFGGWDYFDPIALIEAGRESYNYTIPVNFGKIYAKDWTGKDIPAKYQLPTDKIRFFLTPKSQTPMKSLQSVVGNDPVNQVLDFGFVPGPAGFVRIRGTFTVDPKNKTFLATPSADVRHLRCVVRADSSGHAIIELGDSENPKVFDKFHKSGSTASALTVANGKTFDIRVAEASTDTKKGWSRFQYNGTDYYSDAWTPPDLGLVAAGSVCVYGIGDFTSIQARETGSSGFARYMMPSTGYNEKGALVAGFYCSITHKFYSSKGSKEFVAGLDDAQYHKDLLLDVPVRGMSDLMSCHVHDWDYENVEILVPATCTQKGNGQVACKAVGCPFPDARLAVEIDAIGHVWGDWVVEKPATCTEEGYEVRSCTRELCDHIGSPETNKIAKLPHQRIFVKEEGGKLYYSCANCETELTPENPAYGQIWDWLQSDGIGYITTDYKPSFLATKIVSDVAKWSKATTSCLYSDDITGTSGKFQLRIWTSGTISFYNWPYADDGQYPCSEAKFADVQVGSPFQHVAYQDRAIFRGETSESGANEHWSELTDATRRAGKPLVFFADLNSEEKDASKRVRYVATAKVRGFKVYEVAGAVETLVHDYVPATKDGKNAGLWDRVENKFWPATSAGFTAGKNLGLSIVIR